MHLGLHNRGGDCQLWEVGQVEGAGRGLIASRNITAGEVVLRDWPAVQGPLVEAGQTVCSICAIEEEGEVITCMDCSLPVCKSRSKGCSTQHHRECEVLGGKGKDELSQAELYNCVAVVRMVWRIERDSYIRALIEPLMDHRMDTENPDRVKIATFLGKNGLEEEQVYRALGVLQTNGVTSDSVGGIPRTHALYPVFSITNHSCLSNTRYHKEKDAFCLVATVDIPKGVEVTTCYTSPEIGNITRRPQFRRLWYFDCSCPRCSDPEELGSMASALVCSKCPGHQLPVIALDYTSDWVCDRCGTTQTVTQVEEKTNRARDLVHRGATGGVQQLEKLLQDLAKIIHPRHYLAMQVKRMLCLMYGNCDSHRLDKMTVEELRRKAELCREYISVFSILIPGLTKWRGRLCEELARTLIKLEGRTCLEALRLLCESGKCRKLDSQGEQAAFSMRMATMMSG